MSKLTLVTEDDIRTNGKEYRLYIPGVDLVTVRLDPMDKALLDDIEHGEPSKTPIADRLLGLETLVRRIEEQSYAPEESPNAEQQ